METVRPQLVLIASSMPLFSLGIHKYFDSLSGFEVLASTTTTRHTLEIAKALNPDILFLDESISKKDHLIIAKRAIDESKVSHVVLFVEHFTPEKVAKAKSAGISYVLSKNCNTCDLKAPLYEINKYHSPMNHTLGKVFSQTERKILKLIAKKLTTRQIALALNNSPRTIENHRYQICRKLEINGKNSLLAFVFSNQNWIQSL